MINIYFNYGNEYFKEIFSKCWFVMAKLIEIFLRYKWQYTLFLLYAIIFWLLYRDFPFNDFSVYIIQHVELLSISYFSSFDLYLKVTLMLSMVIWIYYERRGYCLYFNKFYKSLKCFGPLFQHYLVLSLFIITIHPCCYPDNHFQRAWLYNGDYWAFLVLSACTLFIRQPKTSKDNIKRPREMPIQEESEDILGMTTFIQTVMNGLPQTNRDHYPVVVGLLGSWGAGKSSIFNLLSRRLRILNSGKPNSHNLYTIEVNAHKFENITQLYLYFFDELLSLLEKDYFLPRLDVWLMVKIFSSSFGSVDIKILTNKFLPLKRIDRYMKTYSDWLIKSQCHILCCIDDVDRLHKIKDVKASLRLINLVKANMKNVVLVVALDPKYISSMLPSRLIKIGNASSESSKGLEYSHSDALQADARDEILMKYFDSIYYMPEYSGNKMFQIALDSIQKALKNNNCWNKTCEANFEEIKDSSHITARYIMKNISTIRRALKFDSTFDRNIRRVKNNIDLHAIVLMSVIEVTKSKLFDFIRNNGAILSIAFSDIDQYWERKWSGAEAVLQNKYRISYNRLGLNSEDEEILKILFPHIPKIEANESAVLEIIKEELEQANIDSLLSLREHFEQFFLYENIDDSVLRVITEQNRKEIKDAIENISVDAVSLKEVLNKRFNFENGSRESHRFLFIWLSDQLRNVKSDDAAQKIVLSLALLAKNASSRKISPWSRGEKREMANFVWKYWYRKDQSIALFNELLNGDEYSDAFSNSIIMHSVEEKENEWKKVGEFNVNSLVECFFERLNRKMGKTGSIFDDKIFDELNFTVVAWSAAEQYCKENDLQINANKALPLKKYFLSGIKENTAHFEKFFRECFQINDYNEMVFNPGGYSRALGETLIDAVSYYLEKGAMDYTDNEISVLRTWMEEKKKRYDIV